MKFHIINNRPSSQPSRGGEGVSLAVVQWMELLRGKRAVARECNPFTVEAVRAEEHYCLYCFGVKWFDVVYGGLPAFNSQRLGSRCRGCGRESWL